MKLLIALTISLGLSLTTSAQHQLLQEKSYLNKPTSTNILASSPDKLGNIYYSGLTLVANSKWDNYFLKVKTNGDTLWTKKSSPVIDFSQVMIQALPNNSFIAANSIGPQQTAATLQKRSSTGNLNWTKSFNTSISQVLTLLRYPNNDLLLGGYFSNKIYSFVRTDSLGNVKWTKGYPWKLLETLVDARFTKTGNIITVGTTRNFVGPSHLKVLLLNSNGDSLLGRQLVLTGPNNQEGMYQNFNSVTPLTNGGYLITATVDSITSSTSGYLYRGMIVKVDANLNYQWKYIHRTTNLDEYAFTKAKELTDGTILVLGFKVRPIANGNTDGFQLYRFSPTGQLLNTYPFTSNVCTQISAATFDALPDTTYIIGGGCGNTNPATYGFYVAKVKIPGLPLPLPPVNISGIQEEFITGVGLGQSYPNPTNSAATIPYQLPGNYRRASIIIREITTGREIRKYELKRSESSLSVDVNSLSNGLYLYSLVVDDKQMATKKLAVMK